MCSKKETTPDAYASNHRHLHRVFGDLYRRDGRTARQGNLPPSQPRQIPASGTADRQNPRGFHQALRYPRALCPSRRSDTASSGGCTPCRPSRRSSGSSAAIGRPGDRQSGLVQPRRLAHVERRAPRHRDPTAAHRTLPLSSYARVTHLDSGRSVIVKINDRGPWTRRFIIDLSPRAAEELNMQTRRGGGRRDRTS